MYFFFFFQAEDGIRDHCVTGVQTCALPISAPKPAGAANPEPSAPAPPAKVGLRARWAAALKRRERPLWLAAAVLLALGAVFLHDRFTAHPRALTQDDIDAAVLHTLEKGPLPSAAARAYE